MCILLELFLPVCIFLLPSANSNLIDALMPLHNIVLLTFSIPCVDRAPAKPYAHISSPSSSPSDTDHILHVQIMLRARNLPPLPLASLIFFSANFEISCPDDNWDLWDPAPFPSHFRVSPDEGGVSRTGATLEFSFGEIVLRKFSPGMRTGEYVRKTDSLFLLSLSGE